MGGYTPLILKFCDYLRLLSKALLETISIHDHRGAHYTDVVKIYK